MQALGLCGLRLGVPGLASRPWAQCTQGLTPIKVLLAVRAHLVVGRGHAGGCLQGLERATLRFGQQAGGRQSTILQGHPIPIGALQNLGQVCGGREGGRNQTGLLLTDGKMRLPSASSPPMARGPREQLTLGSPKGHTSLGGRIKGPQEAP